MPKWLLLGGVMTLARVALLNGQLDGREASSGGVEPNGCVVCGINLAPCWTHVCNYVYVPCPYCGVDCRPVE